VPVSVINDSPGFVAQRVVAHIVNVGCDIAQMRIATPQDLDRAVMLGLGYPRGPLAMGDSLGPQRFSPVLETCMTSSGAALPSEPMAQAPREARRIPAYPGVRPNARRLHL
jgi:3-hydroxybutyryl-CoA dehydrogenase